MLLAEAICKLLTGASYCVDYGSGQDECGGSPAGPDSCRRQIACAICCSQGPRGDEQNSVRSNVRSLSLFSNSSSMYVLNCEKKKKSMHPFVSEAFDTCSSRFIGTLNIYSANTLS